MKLVRVTDHLYWGDCPVGNEWKEVFAKFDVVVSLIDVSQTMFRPQNLMHIINPIDDGPGFNFPTLSDMAVFLSLQLDLAHTVLIHCGAGLSRSPFLTTLVLAEHEGISEMEALQKIRDAGETMMEQSFVDALKGIV